MACDKFLEERMNQVLKSKKITSEAKKMMGGLCYMVDDKMCFGIIKDEMMARIDPEIYDSCIAKEGCKEMNFADVQ